MINTFGELIGFPQYNTVNIQSARGETSTPQTPSATPAGGLTLQSTGSFAKWALAMGALWLILVAMHELGGGTRDIAVGLALLIALSVLLTLGPKAVEHLKGLIGAGS